MTTAEGASKPLNRFNTAARTMSHYSMWFAAWLCTTNIVMAFAPQDGTVAWVLLVISMTTAFIPLLLSYYGDRVHMWAWDCPTCVRRSPILNGAEEVVRQRARLQWVHSPRRLMTWGLGSLVLSVAVPFVVKGPWHIVFSVPFYCIWIYTCVAGETHRNLQPWCPWCRGRGGDDVPVDVVPPTPAGVKTDA